MQYHDACAFSWSIYTAGYTKYENVITSGQIELLRREEMPVCFVVTLFCHHLFRGYSTKLRVYDGTNKDTGNVVV